MAASRHLFLLGLGLCFVISCSSSDDVRVYRGDSKNPFEDVTWQLEKQRKYKEELEKRLNEATDAKQIARLEKDIGKITSAIAKMEVTFRVVYKDHIAAIKDKTQNFENEKAKLKKEFEEAEEKHAKAVADLQEAKENDSKQINAYQAKLEESNIQMEKIEREFEALKEIQTEQLEKEKEEKALLIKVRDELTKKLQHAENLHELTMEAMSVSLSQANVKPTSLPHERELIVFRNRAASLRTQRDRGLRWRGFKALLNDLKQFYLALYKESNLPNNISHQELEKTLNIIKTRAKNTKIEQTSRRTVLFDEIQKAKLGNYKEEKVEALKEASKQVDTTNLFLKEIAMRKLFLKSIKEVALLIKEATDASKYAW